MSESETYVNIQYIYSIKEKRFKYGEIFTYMYKGINGIENIMKYVHGNHKEIEFDLSVIKQALIDINKCRPEVNKITINVCKETLMTEGSAEKIIDLTKRYETKGIDIIFECIEDTKYTYDESMKNIIKLNRGGYEIAIDDFGTYMANINLVFIPFIDIVKVDRVFVNMLKLKDGTSEKILKSILDIINASGKIAVIEGIENEEELETVKNIGYDLVQGYYFDRPSKISNIRNNKTVKEGVG